MAKNKLSFKPILAYPNNIIDHLCFLVSQQAAVTEYVRKVLPSELACHAKHCVIKDKKLVIYTDSPNWASQIRFYGSEIMNALDMANFSPVSALQVKIFNNPVIRPSTKMRQPVLPSPTVTDELRQLSQNEQNPELSMALKKLGLRLSSLQKPINNSPYAPIVEVNYKDEYRTVGNI